MSWFRADLTAAQRAAFRAAITLLKKKKEDKETRGEAAATAASMGDGGKEGRRR